MQVVEIQEISVSLKLLTKTRGNCATFIQPIKCLTICNIDRGTYFTSQWLRSLIFVHKKTKGFSVFYIFGTVIVRSVYVKMEKYINGFHDAKITLSSFCGGTDGIKTLFPSMFRANIFVCIRNYLQAGEILSKTQVKVSLFTTKCDRILRQLNSSSHRLCFPFYRF